MSRINLQPDFNLPPGEEEILVRYGFKMARREVQFSEIDWDKSSHNRARMQEIDREHLEDLTNAAKEGAKFPDCVLADSGAKKLVIWSGNHRLRSMKAAGKTSAWVVIIECKDELLESIVPTLLNVPQGLRVSQKDRISKAADAIKIWGWTAVQASKAFNVSNGSLTAFIRAKQTRQALEDQRISTGSLNDSQLNSLFGVADNDHVLGEVCRMAIEGNMSSDAIRDVVREVKKERSESGRLEVAKNLKKKLVGETHKSNGSTAKTIRNKTVSFKIAVSSLSKLLQGVSNVRQFGFTDKEEISKAIQDCERLAKDLKRVAAGKAKSL